MYLNSTLDFLSFGSGYIAPPTLRDPTKNKRLTIVQFGDYGEAVHRFARGGAEDYYAQRYSVDAVGALATDASMEAVTVITFSGNREQEMLPNGVRALGVELYPPNAPNRIKELISAVAATRPTHLVVAAPIVQLIYWGVCQGIPVLPLFADSFRQDGLKARAKHSVLSHLLNHPAITLVANHNLAASHELKRIGVKSSKIVPFDWPQLVSPSAYPAKNCPAVHAPFRLIFVGSVIETKGVGDLIRAIRMLQGRGTDVTLSIVGTGEVAAFEALAADLGVAEQVTFLGRRSHDDVLKLMNEHDAVVVPSQHRYPEGLPMTIYEGLCSRSPVIVSDHPMFALRMVHEQNALVFRERDSADLADCVTRLIREPNLYGRLSSYAEVAADGYLCPLKWEQLIQDFLAPASRHALLRFALDPA